MLYRFGDYELDDQLYELSHAGEPVEVERKVYDVLAYLIQHRDRMVTKDELLDKLWPGQVVGEAALTRCITSARKALGDDGNRQEFIRTQHGRGYRFVAAITALAAPVQSSTFQVPRSEEVVSTQEQSANGQVQEASVLAATTNAPPLRSHAPAPSHSRRGIVVLLGFVLIIGLVIAVEWRFVRSLNAPPAPAADPSAPPLAR